MLKTSVGSTFDNQPEYEAINFAFGANDQDRYYPGRGNCQLNVSGFTWKDSWFWFSSNSQPSPVSVNLITNGDFSNGTNNWELEVHTDKGCSANWQVIGGALKVNVTSVGSNLTDAMNNPYRVQVKQTVTTLESNTKYRISFDCKATILWSVITITQNQSPWGTVGIYKTIDLKNTWQTIKDIDFTTPANVISNNKFNFQVGSGVGEIWIKNVALTKILGKEMETKESIFLPQEFQLFQNYPNPFNPITNISFQLPKNGWVSLKIYNLLGQKVENLFDGIMDAGQHSIFWNATKFPAGIYLCCLTFDSQTKTIRLILLK